MYSILVNNLSGIQTAHSSTCPDLTKNSKGSMRYNYATLEILRSDVEMEMEEMGLTGSAESYVRFLPCTVSL